MDDAGPAVPRRAGLAALVRAAGTAGLLAALAGCAASPLASPSPPAAPAMSRGAPAAAAAAAEAQPDTATAPAPAAWGDGPPVTVQVPPPALAPLWPARAVWLDAHRLRWPGVAPVGADGSAAARVRLAHSAQGTVVARAGEPLAGADGVLELEPADGALPPAQAARWRWVGDGATFAVREADRPRLPALHRGQLVLVRQDAAGRVVDAAQTQTAAALDGLYAAAAAVDGLGVTVAAGATRWRLWAPTARRVWLHLHDGPAAPSSPGLPMARDAATGVWEAVRAGDLSGRYYRYAVEVFVPGHGVVRNLVTDPYSVSLSADSRLSYVADLDAPALKPAGWDASAIPARVAHATDLVVYELHVRDFSAGDASVRPAWRGKYLAFAEPDSAGMRHLRALARAGLTDVHLLPIFDLATVPERGCTTPVVPAAAPDSDAQQAAVVAAAARDCFNWGYDPWHFNAPEGSYATDADDGAVRVRELRRMVMALHDAGLRAGMDVVYNHTTASGQDARSVLDRIVPGYYHRREGDGAVARSTCCDNTATEHAMMEKLMSDSVRLWARHYKIASFRFDLMGHQPRDAMVRLQAVLDADAGRRVHLFGEGWDFGEVAGGARFVQAAQGRLDGTGIGTFADKPRDAVRGGSGFDSGEAIVANQGWINGLHHDPNALAPPRGPGSEDALRRAADAVRGGLAGSLRGYRLLARDGTERPLSEVDGVGYVAQPGEVVNYVENHDNATFFDNNAAKLPRATSADDRARVQVLGIALVALSQGVAYYHAGIELLRSKSLDRNSFDSGDWFNRLDWSGRDNGFGAGLPPAADNGASWPVMRTLLADPSLKPGPAQIAFARDAFLDWLRIRAGTTLLRLRSADDVQQRLRFLDTGPQQQPGVIAAHIDGTAYPGAGWRGLVYVVNAGPQARTVVHAPLARQGYALHPVLAGAGAADRRVAEGARVDDATGGFTVPARSAAVFVAR